MVSLHCPLIGDILGPTVGLEAVEEKTNLFLPGIELRPSSI
jgi:hypothetical protein